MMSKRFPTEERNECLGDIQVSEPLKRTVLREYHDGEVEKYLSTQPRFHRDFAIAQHERDQETGLDYRGARFYVERRRNPDLVDLGEVRTLELLSRECGCCQVFEFGSVGEEIRQLVSI